jgi:periplasmic copper chaperone A
MLRRTLAAGALAAGAVVLLASPASAHVTVSAPEAEPGGFATLTFSVPNERDDATTTSVRVTMPEDAPLAFVSVEPVPGWTVDVQKAQLDEPIQSDEGGEITEAVSSVTWSGGSIEAGQFQRFVVSAGPLPEDADSLSFPAVQTYSDGEEVRWIQETSSGGEEPENPAPVLELTEAGTDGGATADTSDDTPASPAADEAASADLAAVEDDADSAKALGIVGIVVGAVGLLVALGALLARRRPTGSA